MRLLFVTGSRGEWGYIRPILELCRERSVDFHICVTNMHLLAAHGLSVNEIRADGFEPSDEIFMSLEGHNHFTMAKSLSVFMKSFTDSVRRLKPDWIVLAGDRGEQLMAAIVGGFTYTPVGHIQAGELSGNIDGVTRHALGKFAHMHFAANEDAGSRLRLLGEEEFRIHVVGAPQLDDLVRGRVSTPEEMRQRHSFDLGQPYLLVIQHPVTEEYAQADQQVESTCEALARIDMPKLWVLPNNDAGSDMIRQGLLRGRGGDTRVFENLPRADYLALLKHAQCVVGNSSSGLLEAPTFKVPAVNLGRRQADRVQGANVINAPFEVAAIVQAIEQATSAAFRGMLQTMVNPYGDGRSSERILQILESTPRDTRLLRKRLTY